VSPSFRALAWRSGQAEAKGNTTMKKNTKSVPASDRKQNTNRYW
jgi:hypothetical protein